MGRPEGVHASCVLVGEAGILIRGPSGAGKSRLALDLVLEAQRRGRFGRLVCDDRITVEACHGRLVARAVPAIAGLIELRGLGLAPTPAAPGALIRLVVDCRDAPGPRLPEPAETTTIISGIALPRIAARVEPGLAARVLLWFRDNDATLGRQ